MSAAQVSFSRDWNGAWIAHGTAAGVPFVAEGATEQDAMDQAVALVFECHTARQMRANAALHLHLQPQAAQQQAEPCSI